MIFAFAISACIGTLAIRFSYYGSLSRRCISTESELDTTKIFKDGKVDLIADAYIATGKDPAYACSPELGLITTELVGPEIMYNPTIDQAFFEREGRKINLIHSRSAQFRVKKMIAVTKHGMTTIDSGSDPSLFLILEDSRGVEYKIATVGTGINPKDRFLKSVTPQGDVLLSPDFFR